MFSCNTAWSPITLLLVPAWMLPTVRTAGSVAAISRATTVCSRITIMAASTTGLPRKQTQGRQPPGMDGGLRHRAVRAAPMDGDPQAVGGRQRRAGPGGD